MHPRVRSSLRAESGQEGGGGDRSDHSKGWKIFLKVSSL